MACLLPLRPLSQSHMVPFTSNWLIVVINRLYSHCLPAHLKFGEIVLRVSRGEPILRGINCLCPSRAFSWLHTEAAYTEHIVGIPALSALGLGIGGLLCLCLISGTMLCTETEFTHGCCASTEEDFIKELCYGNSQTHLSS